MDESLADLVSDELVSAGVKRSRDEIEEAEEDELAAYELAENSLYEANKPSLPPATKRPKLAAHEAHESATAPICESVLHLPPEIMLKIFVYLSFVDLANCGLVCHQWRSISSDDALWKRLYYEVWGTSAKTWKQLFGSHYPEHEEIDMQQLAQQVTKMQPIGTRRGVMGLYRLDKSYVGKQHLRYPTLYRDVWALSSHEVKSIVANEVVLTARGDNSIFEELILSMQRHGGAPEDWKEITSYDRAQNIFWEMLRYEGENEKKTWMEEEDANSCTEWLFGYFPYRKLRPEQLQAIRTAKALEKKAKQAAEEAEQAGVAGEEEEEERANGRVIGAGVIVGVGEVIEDEVEEDEEEVEEDLEATMTESAPSATTTATTTPAASSTTSNSNSAHEEVVMVEEENVAPLSSVPVLENVEPQPSEDIQIEMEVVTPAEPIKASEVIIHEVQNTNSSDDLAREEIVLEEEEEEEEAQPETETAAEEPLVIEESEPSVSGERFAQQPQQTPNDEMMEASEAVTVVPPSAVESVIVEASTTAAQPVSTAEATEAENGESQAAAVVNELAAVEQRGRSQVARFFHTGPIKLVHDMMFVYGFAAISSSRFCTYWIEAVELDDDVSAPPEP